MDQRAHFRAREDLLFARTHDEIEAVVVELDRISNRLDSAGVWNDLAVAYALRSSLADHPTDLLRAWEALSRARERDPRASEPVFNEALVCHHLGIVKCFDSAVESLIAIDPQSAWTAELVERQVAAELPVSPPDGLLYSLLTEAINTHLKTWAAQALVAPEQAERSLALARSTAQRLLAAGDSYLAKVLAGISGPASNPEAGRRRQLLLEGLGHLPCPDQPEPSEARGAAFARAADVFSQASSPLKEWAAVQLARSEYLDNRFVAAREQAIALRRTSAHSHRLIRGFSWWIQGASEGALTRSFEAIAAYEQSLEDHRALGDSIAEVMLETRIAELERVVGDVEVSWRRRLATFRQLGSLPASAQHFAFSEASFATTELGQLRVSRRFGSWALESALASENPNEIVVALIFLAQRKFDSGQLEAAQSLLAEVRAWAPKVLDEGRRQSNRVLSTALEGRLVAEIEPRRAVELFSQALAEATGSNAVALLVERSRAHADAGDGAAARQDLEAALARIETSWQEALSLPSDSDEVQPELWTHYLDHRRGAFDAFVDLLLDLRNHEEALAVAERLRLQAWSQTWPADQIEKLNLDQGLPPALQSSIPPRTTVISYWALPDRLAIWLVDSDDIQLETVFVTRVELERRVQSLLAALNLRRPESEILAHLRWFDEHLAAPIRQIVPAETSLVIVPDGALNGVPFAALLDRQEFLVERHPITLVPSVASAMVGWQRASLREVDGVPSILTLSPSFDAARFNGELYPDLKQLSGASREAERIASLYPQGLWFDSDRATLSALAHWGPGRQVIHIAGHAVSTPRSSYLVLTVDDLAPKNIVYASDLERLQLEETRLVVLSACRSAGGHRLGAFGVSRLVRPLLIAGVHAVVGSLWDVNDRATPQLMTDFHQALLDGMPTDEALRWAQRAAIDDPAKSTHAVAVWASFQVVGSTRLNPESGASDG